MRSSRVLVLLAAAAVLTSCSADGGPPATPDAVRAAAPVELGPAPYTVVDARTIAVVVPVGGGCAPAGQAEVAVAETASTVTVRAHVRPAPASSHGPLEDGTCPAVLRTAPVTVELSAPLGVRTVVDGVGGRVVPPGAWPGLTG